MATEIEALVSVRSIAEALLAAHVGVTLIDCKEPRAGALGALEPREVERIVGALRGRSVEISATVGDRPGDVEAAVAGVAACGVDVVKVGVESAALLWRLAALPQHRTRIVPVLVADRGGLDAALVDAACRGFGTVMVDTADKRAGSVFDAVPAAALRGFIEQARRHRVRAGIAGALRLTDLPRVLELRPDFAGFRSAVCNGGERGGELDALRLRAVLAALRSATDRSEGSSYTGVASTGSGIGKLA